MAAADALLAQGAEGRLFSSTLNGLPTVVKVRFSKSYRHPDIDLRLRTTRMGQEAKMLLRARQAGVATPTVYFVNFTECSLHMERIDGPTVKRFVQERPSLVEPELHAVAAAIGRAVAKLHDAEIIHGDLTTSNMMMRNGSTDRLVLIDFGLSQTSTLANDKAVDLYVCEKAFLSTHPDSEKMFVEVLDAYRKASKRGAEVIAYLDKVRARGRKKICLG